MLVWHGKESKLVGIDDNLSPFFLEDPDNCKIIEYWCTFSQDIYFRMVSFKPQLHFCWMFSNPFVSFFAGTPEAKNWIRWMRMTYFSFFSQFGSKIKYWLTMYIIKNMKRKFFCQYWKTTTKPPTISNVSLLCGFTSKWKFTLFEG